jgi:hypothetical protein
MIHLHPKQKSFLFPVLSYGRTITAPRPTAEALPVLAPIHLPPNATTLDPETFAQRVHKAARAGVIDGWVALALVLEQRMAWQDQQRVGV